MGPHRLSRAFVPSSPLHSTRLPENTWTGSLEPIPPDEATNGTESFDNPPEDARTDVQYGETGGVQGSP